MSVSVQRALEDLRVVSAGLRQESFALFDNRPIGNRMHYFVLARFGSASDSATAAPPTS